ncbi:hypothetical protein AAG570_008559 [Ranatra chinensis]|uniref:Uncharacterized protein n=1 Tax=Ranatra chinensis TaxID=642074 RepID=A0ABD0YRA9_9HEMI
MFYENKKQETTAIGNASEFFSDTVKRIRGIFLLTSENAETGSDQRTQSEKLQNTVPHDAIFFDFPQRRTASIVVLPRVSGGGGRHTIWPGGGCWHDRPSFGILGPLSVSCERDSRHALSQSGCHKSHRVLSPVRGDTRLTPGPQCIMHDGRTPASYTRCPYHTLFVLPACPLISDNIESFTLYLRADNFLHPPISFPPTSYDLENVRGAFYPRLFRIPVRFVSMWFVYRLSYQFKTWESPKRMFPVSGTPHVQLPPSLKPKLVITIADACVT